MAILSKQQTASAYFMSATYVDWNKQRDVENMEKKLKKVVKKSMNTKDISINRLNSFLVLEAALGSLLEVDQRKSAEKNIEDVLRSYAEQLNSELRDQLIYNGDSHIYHDAFEELEIDLKDQLYNRLHGVVNDVEEWVEQIIGQAAISVWDFPGSTGDRIVLPDLVATMNEDSDVELSSILDELIIANFARSFLPFSTSLIDRSLVGLSNLKVKLKQIERVELTVAIERMIRNFIGSISGVQESLKQLTRQVQRVAQVVEEVEKELEKFPSKELDDWVMELHALNTSNLLAKISRLNDLINDVKPPLRLLLINNNGKKDSINSILETAIEIKALANGLVQWVHRFSGIEFFTTIEGGIAYETVEDEHYNPETETIIEAQKLFKMYRRGGSTVYALRGVDLSVEKGEFLVIEGPSGAGKTTLLNILAGLDTANRGAVFFKKKDLLQMKDRTRTKIRREHFSFIFQNYALIPHLTAFENIKLPIDMGSLSTDLVDDIQQLMDDVGIGDYADHKPAYLSGGQMQRLGIARALVNRPDVIFADEPTGDLDEKTGTKIMELLKQYHLETGVTIVLVTHNPKIADYGTRRIIVKDGQEIPA